MPSAGDFFRLNTPGGFVRVWDSWLQQVMLTGREAYGSGFDAHYMSAPIWRFTLPAGTCGKARVMGVLMPSVDRVGRRFPLTLMAALPPAGSVAAAHLTVAGLFERLEDVALDALEDTMTREKLSEVLAGIPLPEAKGDGLVTEGTEITLVSGTRSRLLAADLEEAELEQQLSGCGVWTAVLEGGIRRMACSGLPQTPAALGLFDLEAPVWSGAGVQ